MACAPAPLPPIDSRSAPRPTRPRQIKPRAGGGDDTQQRRSVVYQGKVDCELAAAGDKLPGAVERVDQKETVVIGRHCPSKPLFGNSGDFRNQPREAVGEDAVGGKVGFRHRRAVDLVLQAHAGAVHGKNGGCGLRHVSGQRLDQRGGTVGVDQRGTGGHRRASYKPACRFRHQQDAPLKRRKRDGNGLGPACWLAARASPVYQAFKHA
jgi:hypothetical protein